MLIMADLSHFVSVKDSNIQVFIFVVDLIGGSYVSIDQQPAVSIIAFNGEEVCGMVCIQRNSVKKEFLFHN